MTFFQPEIFRLISPWLSSGIRGGTVNKPVIQIRGASVRYRLAKEKPKTLQEYIIHRLKGRRLDYEDFWALTDIHLEVLKGETLGIIGNNGAGKSTLLKIIAGVLKPTAGSVTVNGTIAPMIELGAGFDMDLTGLENIYLNASILGISRKHITAKLPDIIAFSELAEFIHSPLRTYSSGMVARLGFSIATEVEPDILIIDEILSVGDEHFTKKCEARMEGFRKMGTTIILVSHTMKDINILCNKVLWLEHGQVLAYGQNVAEITERYVGE